MIASGSCRFIQSMNRSSSCAGVATVFEVEVARRVVAVRRAQHVHLPRAASFERDRIEVAVLARFDVERHHLRGADDNRGAARISRVEQRTVAVRLAAEPHRRGDEALHQVALGRPDVGFVDLDAALLQRLFEAGQLPILLAVEPENRAMLEVAKRKRPKFDGARAADDRFRALALLGRNERHRRLRREPDASRTAVGGEPELDLRPGGRVAPMTGQKKTLLSPESSRCLRKPVRSHHFTFDPARPGASARVSTGYHFDRIDAIGIERQMLRYFGNRFIRRLVRPRGIDRALAARRNAVVSGLAFVRAIALVSVRSNSDMSMSLRGMYCTGGYDASRSVRASRVSAITRPASLTTTRDASARCRSGGRAPGFV